jgi:hypothetical protein
MTEIALSGRDLDADVRDAARLARTAGAISYLTEDGAITAAVVPLDCLPVPAADPGGAALAIARDLQDTLARISPQYGMRTGTWDELGSSETGQLTRNLVREVTADLIRRGVLSYGTLLRDTVLHLARGWEAQAAQFERDYGPDHAMWRKAYALRECAAVLRKTIAGLGPQGEQASSGTG